MPQDCLDPQSACHGDPSCAGNGQDGDVTLNGGVINTCGAVMFMPSQDVVATSPDLSAADGRRVLLLIGTGNVPVAAPSAFDEDNMGGVGRWHVARATVTNGGPPNATLRLEPAPPAAFPSSSVGLSLRAQVCIIPEYDDVTLTGTVTAAPWNGATGGVVALFARGTLQNSGGAISAVGQGYRGGAGIQDPSACNGAQNPGGLGEGLLGSWTSTMRGFTPRDNGGGGGSQGHGGGGGGANRGQAGAGGRGACGSGAGSAGGIQVIPDDVRLLMGGGGGGGTGPGAGAGGAGGGIALVFANTLDPYGVYDVSGADGQDALLAHDGSPAIGGSEGAGGGGGAGGTLVMWARDTYGVLVAPSARGGQGGDARYTTVATGAGGGGGGGYQVTVLPVTPGCYVEGGFPGTVNMLGTAQTGGGQGVCQGSLIAP